MKKHRLIIKTFLVSSIFFTQFMGVSKVSAAAYDFTNLSTNKTWQASQWRNDDSIKSQMIDDIINTGADNFKYEAPNGSFYNYKKLSDNVNSEIKAGKSKSEAFNSALANSDNYYNGNSQNESDFDVVSID